MGYYTSIIFMGAQHINRPLGKEISEDYEQEDIIHSEVDSEASDINNLSDENDPIMEISLRHKDWVIEVEGRGGNQEDIWRRRYLNGEYEEICPEWPSYTTITHPEN